MKRVETILDDADYSAYEKASEQEGRSMRLQSQFLIRSFLKERGEKIKENKCLTPKHNYGARQLPLTIMVLCQFCFYQIKKIKKTKTKLH